MPLPSVAAPSTDRLKALDGLRGIAACMVVLGHTRLIVLQNYDSPAFHAPGIEQALNALGTLGSTAVWLFFVLSGLVLARMFINRPSLNYGRYTIQRLVRLYVPVWGAVALTFLSMLLISRQVDGLGPWLTNRTREIDPSRYFMDLTLIGGVGGNDTPLWSLRWEVLFSLLLIVYLHVATRIHSLVTAAACIALSAIGGHIQNEMLLYMPMFGVGVAVAVGWERLNRIRHRVVATVPRLHHPAALAILAALILIQFIPWYFGALHVPASVQDLLTTGLRMVSVSGIVVLVALASSLRWLFANRVMLWLGMISYSLYLVHEIVLLAFVYPTHANLLALTVAVCLAFPAAWLFYRLVEKPSHVLSRRAGQTDALRPRARTEAVAEP